MKIQQSKEKTTKAIFVNVYGPDRDNQELVKEAVAYADKIGAQCLVALIGRRVCFYDVPFDPKTNSYEDTADGSR